MREIAAQSPCKVCGGTEFTHTDILWPELINQWQLSASEVAYVNIQQGTCCTSCGSNVRSIALAAAILRFVDSSGTLDEWACSASAKTCQVLEINEAGTLTPLLQRLPGHRLVRYPQCDMMALPFQDAEFDLVVHSDSLEHIVDPVKALEECRRILSPAGACIFTIPVIVGRLTKSRQGLPYSLHGDAACADESMIVHTEFGADMWRYPIEAGFSDCRIVTYAYPAGVALIATNNRA